MEVGADGSPVSSVAFYCLLVASNPKNTRTRFHSAFCCNTSVGVTEFVKTSDTLFGIFAEHPRRMNLGARQGVLHLDPVDVSVQLSPVVSAHRQT